MLIIRRVNLFPCQIEAVLIEEQQLAPNYLLDVRRKGRLDRAELSGKLNADGPGALARSGGAPAPGLRRRDRDNGCPGGDDRAFTGQGQADQRSPAETLK